MPASSWVHLDVDEITNATDKAIQIVIDGISYWIPRSQISEGDKYEAGDRNVTVSVTEWIAEQKGIGPNFE